MHLCAISSSRRKCLYLMELSNLRKSPRTPGLVMHWQLLQTSIMTASPTCWWEPLWRMNTGGPSMSTMDTVFTSSMITSRYSSFVDIYIFTGVVEISITPISALGWSQRIPGASVSPSLQYFGRSVSARLDLDGDELIDLAVGAQGSAVLLRWVQAERDGIARIFFFFQSYS